MKKQTERVTPKKKPIKHKVVLILVLLLVVIVSLVLAVDTDTKRDGATLDYCEIVDGVILGNNTTDCTHLEAELEATLNTYKKRVMYSLPITISRENIDEVFVDVPINRNSTLNSLNSTITIFGQYTLVNEATIKTFLSVDRLGSTDLYTITYRINNEGELDQSELEILQKNILPDSINEYLSQITNK